MIHPIRNLLFEVDPYENFPVRESSVDGWNSQHPRLAELLVEMNLNPLDYIVEIGSWKGASALWMAQHTPAHILCIDTWCGSQEMWSDHTDETRYGSLKIEHGQPTVMKDFMSNVIREGKEHQITPMPLPSSIALKLLDQWKLSPKLIYVDGDHSVSGVTTDIELSMRLRPTYICGDDFLAWPTVARAVKKWFGNVNVEQDGFWYLNHFSRLSSAAIE